ncbi:MAG: zinc-binding dehydrogenase [Alphaproteobacteria bacterium]|nr:zinc-binding dehydrogenase [Alphaproteobacteria bacterium]
MKAMVLREHGAGGLHYEAGFPDPAPGPGDVVVRVGATALNYHDVFTRRGMPGIRIGMPAIMGLDVAGEIAALGAGVSGWKVGDRVLGDPINRVEGGLTGETVHGGLAEYCRLRAHQLVAIPDGIDFVQAAALPCAYGTARRMMYTNGRVAAGEKVLILGASGGVGVCCVQLAKLAGATVIAATSSTEKAARLIALGADHTIDTAEEDFVDAIYRLYGKPTRRGAGSCRGVDVVVNYTGGDTWTKSLRILRVGGRLLTCGATAGYDPPEDIRYIWTYELQILGSNGWAREDITALLDLVQSGRLAAVVDATYPLERAAEALDRLENRQVFGKLVITP